MAEYVYVCVDYCAGEGGKPVAAFDSFEKLLDFAEFGDHYDLSPVCFKIQINNKTPDHVDIYDEDERLYNIHRKLRERALK